MAEEKYDELTKIIDTMVMEKTFSMEAVKAIQALRNKAEEIENTNKDLVERVQAAQKSAEIRRQTLKDLQADIDTWRARVDELTTREKAVTAIERDKATANARAETFKECFALVFRNMEVRREMIGTVPMNPSESGAYPSGQPTQETVTESKS